MGVGHAPLALGAAKATPRLNVDWLVFAAFLADFLLGIFAWMGLESAHVPENYAAAGSANIRTAKCAITGRTRGFPRCSDARS